MQESARLQNERALEFAIASDSPSPQSVDDFVFLRNSPIKAVMGLSFSRGESTINDERALPGHEF